MLQKNSYLFYHRLFWITICQAVLAVPLLHAEQQALEKILHGAIRPDAVQQEFDTPTFDTLLEYATTRQLTLLELFNDVITVLTIRGTRARVSGDVVRESTDRYELGGRRMNALFPSELIDYFEIGDPRNGAPQLDIYLTGPPPTYFESVNIQIERNYGFKSVSGQLFDDGFGISAGILIFSFEVERFELYGPQRVAIYMRDFDRPKRWLISAVKNKDA